MAESEASVVAGPWRWLVVAAVAAGTPVAMAMAVAARAAARAAAEGLGRSGAQPLSVRLLSRAPTRAPRCRWWRRCVLMMVMMVVANLGGAPGIE